MNKFQHLSIYGDSILKGVVLNPETGRYTTQSDFDLDGLAARYGLELNNYSRFGCTVTKGLTSLKMHLEKNIPCDVALIELGGNDSNFKWEEVEADPDGEHFSATPLPEFKRIYNELIVSLKERGILPIICSLPPLCAERYLSWITRTGLSRERILRWLGDTNAIYRYQERYSLAVEQTAWRLGCPYIDLREVFLSKLHILDYFCEDGIHPNDRGQGLIIEAFTERLNKIPKPVIAK